MATKEQFLDRIANRLGRERRTGARVPEWKNNPWDNLRDGPGNEGQVELFRKSLEALGGRFYQASGAEEIKEVLKEILEKEQVKSLVYNKDQRLLDLGLAHYLDEMGIETRVWDPAGNHEELKTFAEQADAGIVFADLGLAETATVLFYNGGPKGRSVSLLPPVFITFLRKRDMVPRLTQAVAHLEERAQKEGLPAYTNFVTGPSRSGDIEMDLSIGVHGPASAYVILLDP